MMCNGKEKMAKKSMKIGEIFLVKNIRLKLSGKLFFFLGKYEIMVKKTHG